MINATERKNVDMGGQVLEGRNYVNVYSKLQFYLKAPHALYKKGILKEQYFPLSGQYESLQC